MNQASTRSLAFWNSGVSGFSPARSGGGRCSGRTKLRWAFAGLIVLSGCTTAASEEKPARTTSTAGATTAPAPTTTTAAAAAATRAVPARSVADQAWIPFATAGAVTLSHPSNRVERIGFHQSNHEGAQPLTALATAVHPATLEARARLTSAQAAADVVMDPAGEVRAPVTGRVKRSGTYTLYCRYSDDYVVIAPDANPRWEVKILHIDGVRVRRGDRVEAGVTVIAPRPTQLPFGSQVDELRTVDPAWPHVHIEVVDPAIKNTPSPGGGCN